MRCAFASWPASSRICNGQKCFSASRLERHILEIGELVAVEAMIEARGLLEMNATATAAKWTALLERKVAPFPDASEFRHCILVVSNDFECIGVLGDEPLLACAKDD